MHTITMKSQMLSSCNFTNTREVAQRRVWARINVDFFFSLFYVINDINIKISLKESCMFLLKFVLFIWKFAPFLLFQESIYCILGTSLFWEVIWFVYNLYHSELKYIQRWINNFFLNIFLCVSAREINPEQQEIASGTVMHWERPSKESNAIRYSSQKHFLHQERIRDGVLHLEKYWICWHHSSHSVHSLNLYSKASYRVVAGKASQKTVQGRKNCITGFTLCTRLDEMGCLILPSLSRSAVTPRWQCWMVPVQNSAAVPAPHSAFPWGTAKPLMPSCSPGCVPTLWGAPCQAGGSEPWFAQSLSLRSHTMHP